MREGRTAFSYIRLLLLLLLSEISEVARLHRQKKDRKGRDVLLTSESQQEGDETGAYG